MQCKISCLILSSILLSSIAVSLCYGTWLLPLNSTTKFTSTTTIASLDRNSTPFPSAFSFTIKLLTFNRVISLQRCLTSLAHAEYNGDRVNLHVFVDHLKSDGNGSDVLDSKLEESRRVLDLVDGFQWEHGEKMAHYRTKNGGLQAQWLESWWPVTDDEFVYVVEDDVVVSSLYYQFLKGLIAKYYYDPENFSPYIYGASLQRLKEVIDPFVHSILSVQEILESQGGATGQACRVLGRTWTRKKHECSCTHWSVLGASFCFPDLGRNFDGGTTTTNRKASSQFSMGRYWWYKLKGEKIWTPWIIKFAHSRNYYNIYTNFKDGRALSVSHRDAGVNFRRTLGPDSPLLEKKDLDFDLWELRPLADLKRFDYCSRPVLPGRSAGSFDELDSILRSPQEQKTILLISVYGTAEPLIKNLLCHLGRLNIQRYIFIGNDHELLHDLARRGHPVVDGTKFSHSLRKDRLSGFPIPNTELINEVMVTAYVIRKCLEHGYDTWIVDGNMVPVSAHFMATPDSSHHLAVAKDAGFLFVRSSQSALNVWADDFILEVARATASSPEYGSTSMGGRYFPNLIGKVLKDGKYADTTISVHVMRSGMSLGDRATFMSSEYSREFVSWNPDMGLDLVRRKLEMVGMWLLDGDSSCNSVYCHGQSVQRAARQL